MSNYQGKRFKLSQIPDPANPGAPRPVQPGRTSSSQPVRPPQPAHVARHVRAPQPVAPSNQRVQGALPTCRPSSYGEQSQAHRSPSPGLGGSVESPAPKRKKGRSIFARLLIVIGVCLIAAAAGIYIKAQLGYKEASDSYQKVEKKSVSDSDASGAPIVDFATLAQTNPDVVGWIYVPGTAINYPVVQTDNNTKYLSTLFDGTANPVGSIFLDCDDTAPGMVDQQTTLYGHHMRDNSMFHFIADSADQSVFDGIEYAFYVTRDGAYKFKPLLTKVVEDSYRKARTPNFEGGDGLKTYLSEMIDGASAVASDAESRAAKADKVLTLITCSPSALRNKRAVMILTPVEN